MEKHQKTADAVVFAGSGNALKILLIQRKNQPFQNAWAFPGGFLETPKEHPLEACLRELIEETSLDLTGVDAIELTPRKLPGRDPRGLTKTYAFMFYTEAEAKVIGRDDALTVKWVKLTELKQLAFDHGGILCEALGHFWKSMPSFSVALDGIALPDFMLAATQRQAGVFYGGSFNPWHEGHSVCVAGAPKGTIVVPDCNPWKASDNSQPAQQPTCAWQSFLGICEKLKGKDITIYPGFWGAEVGNPTISWLGESHFESYSLVMGDDSFLSLHNWKDAQKLIQLLTNLYIIPRGGKTEELQRQKTKILNLNDKLQIHFGDHHSFESISSTELRKS